jgi:hypothetical protein
MQTWAEFRELEGRMNRLIARSSRTATGLLAIRTKVIENEGGIFDLPDDQTFVNQRLLALREKLEEMLASLPGGN